MTGLDVHIPVLETKRLRLRPHRTEDFEAFADFVDSDRSGISNRSRAAAWSSFTSDISGWCLEGFGYWAIDLKTGAHIGQTGLCKPPHFPEPEIGWSLYDGYEGQGFATEAARAVLDWVRPRVANLVSYITPSNTRSIAVAERLGAWLDTTAPSPNWESPAETVVYRHWGAS